MELLTLEQLTIDIKQYVEEYAINSLLIAEEIMKDESISVIERINKIKAMPAEVTIQSVTSNLAQVVLFQEKMYKIPSKTTASRDTVGRVKGGGKFQAGQRVRMQHNNQQSEIYTVGIDGNVYDVSNIPFKASILTKNFHCGTLGNVDNGWDMAGLSHNYWVAVE